MLLKVNMILCCKENCRKFEIKKCEARATWTTNVLYVCMYENLVVQKCLMILPIARISRNIWTILFPNSGFQVVFDRFHI